MRRMILAAGAAILLAPIWAAHAECPFFSDAKLNAMFVQHPFVNNPGLEAVLGKRWAGTLSRSGVRLRLPAPRHEFVDAVLRPTVYEARQ